MKPWQVLGLSALVLNGLIVAAFFFAGQGEKINSVFAGALLPILISGALLFWAEHSETNDVKNLQKINIIGFLFKVILLGAWAVILVKAGTLDIMTFIVILVINFLAWHGVEAYYWRLFMLGDAQNTGENS